MDSLDYKVGDSSPWGRIKKIDRIVDGLWSVKATRKSGFKLSPEQVKPIPLDWFTGYLMADGWYENGPELYLALMQFPDALPDQRAEIEAGFEREFPHIAVKFRKPPPGGLFAVKGNSTAEADASRRGEYPIPNW